MSALHEAWDEQFTPVELYSGMAGAFEHAGK
jgi:hypothetical protein